MTELRHRAERAVLGALITDPGSTGYTGLTTEDFDDRRHQVIFTALAGPSQQSGGLLRRLRDWLANRRERGELRELESYLDSLPDACPDLRHLRSYVEMLTASRPQPEPAASSSSTDASATLAEAASTLARPADHHPDAPSDDVARLARVLRSRMPSLDRSRDREPVAAAATAPVVRDTGAGTEPTDISDAPAEQSPSKSREMATEDLEDLVLADLLNHPAAARDVVTWLPITAFTPGRRQQLYELTASMIAENDPVDPLIVAWEADQLRTAAGGTSLDSAFVLRVGALDTPPGTAAELGRCLLADSWCCTTFGDNWHTGPLPEPVESANEPRTAAEPEPAAAHPTPEPRQEPEPRPAPAAISSPPRAAGRSAIPMPAPSTGIPATAPPTAPAFREPVPRP